MVKHGDFQSVVKCSILRSVVQIHPQTNIDFKKKTGLVWSESTQNVSSTEGYVFVPTDPFRAAEK